MFENRGQGTTEYLIILAIVIVIALVVVGVLGGFPSIGTGISQGQSKAYWGSVQPLALIDWSVPNAASGSSGSIVLQNVTASTITMVAVDWNGSGGSFTNTSVIAPGGKATISSALINCNTAGQPFSKTLSYRYTTVNSLTVDFNGTSPVVGNCQ